MKFEKKEVYSYKVIKLFTKPLIFLLGSLLSLEGLKRLKTGGLSATRE